MEAAVQKPPSRRSSVKSVTRKNSEKFKKNTNITKDLIKPNNEANLLIIRKDILIKQEHENENMIEEKKMDLHHRPLVVIDQNQTADIETEEVKLIVKKEEPSEIVVKPVIDLGIDNELDVDALLKAPEGDIICENDSVVELNITGSERPIHHQYKKHKVKKYTNNNVNSNINHKSLSSSPLSSTSSASITQSLSSTSSITGSESSATSNASNQNQPLQETHIILAESPEKIDTHDDTMHHLHNPHNHIHRHRHAHHHRNYARHFHDTTLELNNNVNESTDDPDSVSIPVNLKLHTDDMEGIEDESETDHIKSNGAPLLILDDNNIIPKNKPYNLTRTNSDLDKIKEVTDTLEIDDKKNDILKSSTSSNIIAKSNLISSAGIGLHRSTPNLSNLNEILLLNNENLPLMNDTNYPSNLELSTNNTNLICDLQRKFNDDQYLNTSTNSSNGQLLNNSITRLNNITSVRPISSSTNLMIKSINPQSINLLINNNNHQKRFAQRYKLLTESDTQVCKLPHSRNVISKILNSKLLRRWKAHRLILTDTEIYSTTKTDYMDCSIPYHTIIEVSPISKWEPGQKYCLRIATIECHFLIQTNNVYLRDQWIHSIIWKKHKFKSERVLRNAVRPEVLIKEIKNMIEMSLTTPIDDSEIYQYPLELVSEILQKHHLPRLTHEEVIVGLSPLLEKNHPSPEICDFFSRHCRDSPRSHIVIEMFTPVVQRILKHNGDFGRYPRMRLFVQDYLMALISQNAGLHTVQNFVKTMHSTSSQCPFPRVLPNFVSVCLAAIHGCFEQHHKNYKPKIPPAVELSKQEQEDQLVCYTTMMQTMSNFEDWRAHLAQLLQSVPFPDQALTHDKFIKIFKKVVENFAQDPRCEVHQTLLGIREGKEGWFEIFCPGGISCDDDGDLFGIMLQRLIGCCCKKKRFLLSINKLLSQILVLAVREVPSAIDTLCAMLDLNGVENPDNKLQIVSTLQSTELGLKMYAKVCERQMQLRELQQKGGPRKLTLPSRSTDEDLAKLLLSGSFGNLECLSLAFTNVTSACAEYLIKLPSLRYLNLWSTKFGDEGLELISEHLQRLQVLNLCETPVTDKGLACLASMKQLRKLNLNSTNLSALTFEGLKECLPALQECDIRYTDAW